jgi:outer membrane protein assembly factor BamB
VPEQILLLTEKRRNLKKPTKIVFLRDFPILYDRLTIFHLILTTKTIKEGRMKKRFEHISRFFHHAGRLKNTLCFLFLIFALNAAGQTRFQQNPPSTKKTPASENLPPFGDKRILWRFQMEGLYSFVRPALGPDGTIYAVDRSANLYALSPAGKLIWQFAGAGAKGVAVGADGTIYTASANNIKAINPDGTLKWNFELVPRAFITLGVAVGPDGNIYSVAYESLGVFSLTPEGKLRWAMPESYTRPIVEYGEIVFGLNGKEPQLYFYANARIRAVRLSDGATVFPFDPTPQIFGQPAVSPLDQTVHANVAAFTPNGDLLWLLFNVYPGSAGIPTPDIGPDGIHYVVYPARRLYAINPDGSIRYQRDFLDSFGGPVVSPDNSSLVIGTQASGTSNSIVGFDTANGEERWRVTLPLENGMFQFISTRARFTPDSRTVYLHTATGGSDAVSFLYAIDAGPNAGNLAPQAVAAADRTAGPAPITINFNSDGSFDPDGEIVSYLWDFGDGQSSTAPNPKHVYQTAGQYTAKLTVTDEQGATGETFLPLEFTSGGCVTNCARVTEIRLMAFRIPGGLRFVGTVRVQDENGQPLPDAVVRVGWVVPARPVVPQTATADADGYAQFSLVGNKGTYTLGISLIEAEGYTFDIGNSVRSATITR